MHPLRFSEFLSAYDGDRLDAWDDYFTYGGMPQLLTYTSDESKAEYLKNLFDLTYTRDVMERNNLRKEEKLNDLLNVISSNVGSYTNPTKLERTFKSERNESFPHNQIDHYLDCLEEAYIISRAQRYDVKGKHYIGTPYKVYYEDVGLRNARLNFRQVEESHLMENILYNELRVRGYNVDVGIVKHYGKDKNGKTIRQEFEVDFVANRGMERYYIQSAFALDIPEKIQQEKNSLRRINDSFKKIIVQKDYLKPKFDDDGIVRVGLMNFLLDDDILG
jgi:predicted AAA+ superfamily ATPase